MKVPQQNESKFLEAYLKSFPKDADLELIIEEATLEANRVCLLVKSLEDFNYRLIKGKASNSIVKFEPAKWYSSIEHAIGDKITYLKGH